VLTVTVWKPKNSEVYVSELNGFEDEEVCANNRAEFKDIGVCRSNVAEFIEVSSGGINLMEYMAGFQRAVVIDAIVTGRHKAGTVFKFIYPDIPYTKNTVSTHDMDLPAALELGKHLGISLAFRNNHILPLKLKIRLISARN
jgi:Hydrogenase maturation protease.